MAAPTLDECTAFLQRPNASVNGSTVYSHVSEILLKLVEERPVNPVDVFEEVLFGAFVLFLHLLLMHVSLSGLRSRETEFIQYRRRTPSPELPG